MSYAVRAWRDKDGTSGITIGTVYPVGYDNHVAEIILTRAELGHFLGQCLAATERAARATGPMEEPMPGPYDKWDHP